MRATPVLSAVALASRAGTTGTVVTAFAPATTNTAIRRFKIHSLAGSSSSAQSRRQRHIRFTFVINSRLLYHTSLHPSSVTRSLSKGASSSLCAGGGLLTQRAQLHGGSSRSRSSGSFVPATGKRWRRGAGAEAGTTATACGPLMATSTFPPSPPTISERDIMREFASVAAEEASGRKGKNKRVRMVKKERTDVGAGLHAEASAGELVDSSRPTGYR